jgi:glycosyltransferase involved in cell wall biosynthesis
VRVALVHDWLTGMRGGEKCLEVFCELFPQADLYTLIYLPGKVSPAIRSVKIHASWLNRLPKVQNYYRYCLPLFPTAMERFDLKNYDLVLSSSHCVAKGIFPHRALHISYIHAPMRYVWDMYDAYFGPDASWLARAGMFVWRSYLQAWDRRSSERVDYFLANSANVAAKIKDLYGREATVIHPPVDFKRFCVAQGQEDYYLLVSALVPYKRIDLAVAAFNELKLPLKIVGDGPLRARLEVTAAPNIEFTGWIDPEALLKLYASCQALIFPGEEDFGIAPLEAQASGRPVIAYGKGGVLESVIPWGPADGAAEPPTGIFFPELNSDSLREAVLLFQTKKHLFDPVSIRKHVSRFSRDRFKAQIGDYVEMRLRERLESR